MQYTVIYYNSLPIYIYTNALKCIYIYIWTCVYAANVHIHTHGVCECVLSYNIILNQKSDPPSHFIFRPLRFSILHNTTSYCTSHTATSGHHTHHPYPRHCRNSLSMFLPRSDCHSLMCLGFSARCNDHSISDREIFCNCGIICRNSRLEHQFCASGYQRNQTCEAHIECTEISASFVWSTNVF